MAGIASKLVHRAVWGGEGAPFPDGMWYGEVAVSVVTGADNSILDLLFQTVDAPERDSRLYSLEQFTAVRTGGTQTNGTLQTRNMGLNPTLEGTSEGVLDQFWAFPFTVDAAGLNITPNAQQSAALKGIFLGGQINKATNTGLRLTLDENINNFTVQFNAMGYFWSSKARSVLGGPRRPANALFPG